MNAPNRLTFDTALEAMKKGHQQVAQELEDFILTHRLDDMHDSIRITDKFIERTEAIGVLADLARQVEMIRFLQKLRIALCGPTLGMTQIDVPHYTSIEETRARFAKTLAFGATETADMLLSVELENFDTITPSLRSVMDLTQLHLFLTKLYELSTHPQPSGFFIDITPAIRLRLYEQRPDTTTAGDLACNDPDCLFHGKDNRRTFIQRWQRLRSLAAGDTSWGEPVRIERGAEQAGSGSSSNGKTGRTNLHPKGKPSKSRRRGNRPVVRSNKAKAA